MSAPSTDSAAMKKIIKALREANYTLDSIWDGEEDTPVATTKEAMEILNNLDQAHLYVKDSDGELHWVFFVMGNEPYEVASDYHVSLSPALDPLFDKWIKES